MTTNDINNQNSLYLQKLKNISQNNFLVEIYLHYLSRVLQWDEFFARKPQAGKNHPDDEFLLSVTARTIGDYRLKESPDYKPLPEEKDSTLKKYNELLKARLKVSYKTINMLFAF